MVETGGIEERDPGWRAGVVVAPEEKRAGGLETGQLHGVARARLRHKDRVVGGQQGGSDGQGGPQVFGLRVLERPLSRQDCDGGAQATAGQGDGAFVVINNKGGLRPRRRWSG